jgi:hypothetical protein
MRKLLIRLLCPPHRPKGHPPHVFNDLQGNEYYGWEGFEQMPPARANEIDDVLLQIDAGISRKMLEELSTAIMDTSTEATQAKDKKVLGRLLAKISLLAQELKARPKNIIPEECYYALAAICAVRKDEDPYTFDPTIQAEKMEAFRLAGRAGHDFFTATPAFRAYLSVARISEGALPSLLLSWTAQRQRIHQVLSI